MKTKTGLINFLENTNSAFAADMVKDAKAIHAFASREETGDLKITHWRISSVEDLATLAKNHPDSWIRLLFVFEDGHTQGENIWI